MKKSTNHSTQQKIQETMVAPKTHKMGIQKF